ncbi:MAG TPA: outer membrane protein assembly factor BamD [Terriglobales bacterium]|nr:outer membrane protein assembly factor BamD [Terriglobales bacterium]
MMKPLTFFASCTILVCAIFSSSTFAQAPAPPVSHAALQQSLQRLQALAQKITHASTNQEKAKAWLAMNHEAVKFAGEMNRVFPNSSIQGDKIDPPEAQKLAEKATSYGVRVDFCEPGTDWGANNEGYLKYLELWPDGPDADEATWMGPAGNQSFCGDFEGSVEELQEIIQQNQRFIQQFPNSHFTPEAKERLADAQKMLAEQMKPQEHK